MPRRIISPRGPDRDAALQQYRRRAGVYDRELVLFEPIRRLAISRLALRPADVMFDVGFGTGLSLSMLRQGIGPRGRIVGVGLEVGSAMADAAGQPAGLVSGVCAPA